MVRRFALLVFAFPVADAFADGHAVGLKVGALGLGAEYTYELNERVAFRGALFGSQYGFDQEESGIDYEFDLLWDSLAAGVDFHPTRSPFRLSAGALRNDNRFRIISRPASNVEIGDTVYTPAQVGTLEGSVGFDDTALFAGVGWDWSRDEEFFGLSLDIGLLDQGAPSVTLRGTGTLLGNPAFEQDIAAEAGQLGSELDDLDLVPFLNVGFLFRF
jgi:hypothetical protein